MVEDIARTVWLAMQIGTPQEIPPADVSSLHQRYITKYGQ
jgi:L-ribulose-5-phosphate 4-epimerase